MTILLIIVAVAVGFILGALACHKVAKRARHRAMLAEQCAAAWYAKVQAYEAREEWPEVIG